MNHWAILRLILLLQWVPQFCLAAANPAPLPSPAPSPRPSEPPPISSFLKPGWYSKLVDDREIMTHATLDDLGDDVGSGPRAARYFFYAAMAARAGIDLTRSVLTDFSVYAKIVPYIDRAVYSKETHDLDLQGGIWMFKLHSIIHFDEVGTRWIRYKIIRGHFQGLEGDIVFESAGEKGTVVRMSGSLVQNSWPPRFVIERGAEIVFGFTANRMRSYIESQKQKAPKAEENSKENHDQEIPKPRHRL